MDYEKKVLVLKQVTSGYSVANRQAGGIVRLECENGVCDFYLSLIDLRSIAEGSYHVFVADDNRKLYSFELGKRPVSIVKKLLPCPDLSKGFTASLCHIRDGLPCQVASGKTPDCTLTISELNSIIADSCLADFKKKPKEENLSNDTPNNCDAYDDEAVATENYFDTDEKIQNRLNAIKEWDFESCNDENELLDLFGKEASEEEQACDCRIENETSFCASGEFSTEKPYFLTAKDELEGLFNKFPEENCLKGIFPDSRWARINYSHDKYYLVGVIKENHTEKYICYGVPAVYSETPPEQLKGYCTFIPLSLYDMHGDGFWMIFQDAVTGGCLTPSYD